MADVKEHSEQLQHYPANTLARKIAARRMNTTVSGLGRQLIMEHIQRLIPPVTASQPPAARSSEIEPEQTRLRPQSRAPQIQRAVVMPLAGVREHEPSAEPVLPTIPEPPVETNVANAAEETPEWFKNLPSFEEATSRLRFPDSVAVKLPHTEREVALDTPQPPATPAISPSPAQLARKPAALEPSDSDSRRMRVYTQVEEFASGRQPPPISLQDLRRVHVGEPQTDSSSPPAVQRLPAAESVDMDAGGDRPPLEVAGAAARVTPVAPTPPAAQRLPAAESVDMDAGGDRPPLEVARTAEPVTPVAPTPPAVQRS
ncbi:MAG: hypothetical protein U9Q70_09200, partial [Chloroflexota bacterium]|nr:hypothetical protein [Chloroflexota bacterium]